MTDLERLQEIHESERPVAIVVNDDFENAYLCNESDLFNEIKSHCKDMLILIDKNDSIVLDCIEPRILEISRVFGKKIGIDSDNLSKTIAVCEFIDNEYKNIEIFESSDRKSQIRWMNTQIKERCRTYKDEEKLRFCFDYENESWKSIDEIILEKEIDVF